VANAESRELLVFTLDAANGDLQLVEHVLGGKFTVLAHTPDCRFLFAGLRDDPFGVASFAIDPVRGNLRLIGETRLPGPLAFMSVDSTGRWLLTASYHNDFVAICAIDADGSIREPQQIVRPIPKAHAVLASPANRFIVATSLGSDMVVVWPFDESSGRLDEQAVQQVKVSAGAGPRHLRFHPAMDRLFLVNELDASVRSFDFDATTGQLEERTIASAVPKGHRGKRWAAEIQLTPEGRFMYVSERSSSTITAFRIDAAARMQALGSVPTERQPRAMTIDPSGRFLLAAGQKSNRLSVYLINADSGLLSKLADYAVGGDPCWISILPT
jgi:6-phosphogluconolactonase